MKIKLILFWLFLCPLPLLGQATDKASDNNQNSYTLVFRGTPIEEAIQALVEETKLDLIYDPSILNAQKVFSISRNESPESLLSENLYITVGDDGAFINGSSEIISTDVDVINGVIHAINEVILPNEFLNIVQIAQKDYNLTALVTALSDADLVSTLEGDGPFTVFAPTNDAFEAANDLIATLSASEVSEVLQYHAAAQELLSGDLSDGQTITTVQGEDITVNIGVRVM